MLKRGDLHWSEVRILQSTPRFNNYVWAAQPDVDIEVRDAILDAFLALDIADARHKEILDCQNAKGFVPANDADFESLHIIADSRGLLEERVEPES